jgi:hypothetical protein
VVLPNLIAFFTLARVPSRVLYKPALLPAVLIKAEGGLWAVIRRVKTALVLCSPHSSRDSRIILLVQPRAGILSIDLSCVSHVLFTRLIADTCSRFNQGSRLTVFRWPSQLLWHRPVFRLMLMTLVPV